MTPEQQEAMEDAHQILHEFRSQAPFWSSEYKKAGDAMAALRAALSQEPEQPAAEGGMRVNWQPMNSAPKDGTSVLLCVVGQKLPSIHHWQGVESGSPGHWPTGWRNVMFVTRAEEAICWMPLPPHTAADDPSKKPDSIDTSGPHVDGMDTLAADARELRQCGHPLGNTRWCPDCEWEESRKRRIGE